MKKIVSVCALLIAVCPLNSWAEWTGDSSKSPYRIFDMQRNRMLWPNA